MYVVYQSNQIHSLTEIKSVRDYNREKSFRIITINNKNKTITF